MTYAHAVHTREWPSEKFQLDATKNKILYVDNLRHSRSPTTVRKRSIGLENNVSDNKMYKYKDNKVYKYRKCVHAHHRYKWLKRKVQVEYFPSFRREN